MTLQVNCPECGADPFKTVDYDRIVREQQELHRRFRSVMAKHGLDEANKTVREIELQEGMKYLQRKTLKQAKTITTLENKLKRFKQQPYEKDDQVVIKNGFGQVVG